MPILIFIICFIFSFIISSHVAGHHEGDKLERSLLFTVGKYSVHIHHWIYGIILLGILLCIKYYSPILMGILVGMIAQGLTYRDRFIIVYKTADFNKIYAKYTHPHWGHTIRSHARKIIRPNK